MSAIATPATVAAAPRRRGWFGRLLQSPSGRIGLVLTALVALAALAAVAHLLPHDPVEQHPLDRLLGPSSRYWLGTDQFGRDIFSRCIEGAKSSLQVALVAVGLAGAVGTVAGIAAGFFGGVLDGIVMRIADVLFAFPAILLALAIVSALGSGWFNTAIAIAIVYVPIFARVARGPVLALRDADFIRAGRVLGFSSPRLLFRHILPNVAAPVIVQVTLSLSWAILTESSLSFLGLGTQPPEASLGLMVSDARALAADYWWTLAAPAVAITLAVVGLNLLGDGLRDALDPTRARD
ncbi:MAG TPA: ABC transporter permease [Gaiellaceae bacterium]|nr:ABC transporter permease [Gaiellaceae bacterium]